MDTIPAYTAADNDRHEAGAGRAEVLGTPAVFGDLHKLRRTKATHAAVGNEQALATNGYPVAVSTHAAVGSTGYDTIKVIPAFDIGGVTFKALAADHSSDVYSPKKQMPWTDVSRRLWMLAWPLSWMEVLTFTKELIITSFVGHLGAAELSALVLAQTLYNVTGNAPMLGVVTAMETFCGQAHGAKRYQMVGVVLQRALVLTLLFCLGAVSLWLKGTDMLLWMGQDPVIAKAAGSFTLALAPALVMDAADQCCRRYLSAQAVVQPLMLVTLFATLLTPMYLWYFVFRCGMGLMGAAVAWDLVQATSLFLMVCYSVYHTSCQEPARCTWGGWTTDAFRDWGVYIKMAIPSMIMICEWCLLIWGFRM
eukprot:jgi/Chrzof1/6244/Cz17g17070.t1